MKSIKNITKVTGVALLTMVMATGCGSSNKEVAPPIDSNTTQENGDAMGMNEEASSYQDEIIERVEEGGESSVDILFPEDTSEEDERRELQDSEIPTHLDDSDLSSSNSEPDEGLQGDPSDEDRKEVEARMNKLKEQEKEYNETRNSLKDNK